MLSLKTFNTPMKSYILFNKPYGVLSQFTQENGRKALCDFGPFPKDVYAAGRLDADSEGLIFLTNDTSVNHRLTDPKFEHERTYFVQIEGIPSDEDLLQLATGVLIEAQRTKPAIVRMLDSEPDFPPRSVPIRVRINVPTAWLEMILREGRNRQVRKMTAAVGHPTLRLIRTSITFLTLEGLHPGDYRILNPKEIESLFHLLRIP
jgi:23S rRNA pseudouridine2457 synthase